MVMCPDIQKFSIPGSTNSFDDLTFGIYFLLPLHLHQYILIVALDPTKDYIILYYIT
jgi:hypothetical protein